LFLRPRNIDAFQAFSRELGLFVVSGKSFIRKPFRESGHVGLLRRTTVWIVGTFKESLRPELVERVFLLSVVKCASSIPFLLVTMTEINACENDFLGLDSPSANLEVRNDGGSVDHDSYIQSKQLSNDGLQKRTSIKFAQVHRLG